MMRPPVTWKLKAVCVAFHQLLYVFRCQPNQDRLGGTCKEPGCLAARCLSHRLEISGRDLLGSGELDDVTGREDNVGPLILLPDCAHEARSRQTEDEAQSGKQRNRLRDNFGQLGWIFRRAAAGGHNKRQAQQRRRAGQHPHPGAYDVGLLLRQSLIAARSGKPTATTSNST